MRCPECQKEGKKSNVYVGSMISTAMYCQPYYDEDGNRHFHDMNTTTEHYSCSNGHKFWKDQDKRCWCGWPNKLE